MTYVIKLTKASKSSSSLLIILPITVNSHCQSTLKKFIRATAHKGETCLADPVLLLQSDRYLSELMIKMMGVGSLLING